MSVFVAVVFSFIVAAALILIMAKVAPSINLVDHPCDRKRHTGSVPLVGGIAILLATMLGVLLFSPSWDMFILFTLATALMFVAAFDDVANIPARLRFLIQFIIAAVMVYWGEQYIINIGELSWGDPVELSGASALIFSTLCIVGVINAINMIDGLDGLSGSILLVSVAALAFLTVDMADPSALIVLSLLAGALAAFLYFNSRLFRSRAFVFMGDAGSMSIGLVLSWYFIELSQSSEPVVSSASAGWILGLPLMETVAVMVGRVIDKRSPFQAGRDHLHHRLQDSGLSVSATVIVMLVMHLALVSIGVLFAQVQAAEAPLFWIFVVLTVAHFVVSRYFLESQTRRLRVLFRARSIMRKTQMAAVQDGK